MTLDGFLTTKRPSKRKPTRKIPSLHLPAKVVGYLALSLELLTPNRRRTNATVSSVIIFQGRRSSSNNDSRSKSYLTRRQWRLPKVDPSASARPQSTLKKQAARSSALCGHYLPRFRSHTAPIQHRLLDNGLSPNSTSTLPTNLLSPLIWRRHGQRRLPQRRVHMFSPWIRKTMVDSTSKLSTGRKWRGGSRRLRRHQRQQPKGEGHMLGQPLRLNSSGDQGISVAILLQVSIQFAWHYAPLTDHSHVSVFGVDLAYLIEREHGQEPPLGAVPRILVDCVQQVEQRGFSEIGICE